MHITYIMSLPQTHNIFLTHSLSHYCQHPGARQIARYLTDL